MKFLSAALLLALLLAGGVPAQPAPTAQPAPAAQTSPTAQPMSTAQPMPTAQLASTAPSAPTAPSASTAQPAPAAPSAPGAQPDSNRAEVVLARPDGPRWAIAIHGGAGVIPKSMPDNVKQEYLRGLATALGVGRDVLAAGGTSLDAVEKVVRTFEEDPLFNAGKGAVFTHDGDHELDAAIMRGRDLGCGAVTGVRTVKHPITLARLVMERSAHVFLAADGAEKFADAMKVERVKKDYFYGQRRYEEWQEALREEAAAGAARPRTDRDTVGAVALDRFGDLAAATSTGGITNKRFGRVGDAPVIGAGTYANNRSCAVSSTGLGEEFIRHTVAHDIAALVEYAHLPLAEAARRVVHDKLPAGSGGIIAAGRDGALVLDFNSEGMNRGAADSSGRFEVKIWE
jgi:L-asparaginase / beta-aspartyl-peptidase